MFSFKNKRLFRITYICLFVIVVLIILIFNKEESQKKDEPYIYANSFSAIFHFAPNFKPEFETSLIKNKKQKEKFEKNLREKILELTKWPLEPIPVSEMFVEKELETDKGKYIETKIKILTSKNTLTFAYILIPKNITFPAPTIIAMHPHGNEKILGKDWVVGRKGDSSLYYGKELAERGYVVFVAEAPSFGERKDLTNESDTIIEKRFAQNLFELGYSPLGVTIREDIIGLDFLYSLKIVDKDNIGCVGHSFGGVRCMYLSAVDERIKAAVLSNSIRKFKEDERSGVTHSWLSILPNIAKYTTSDGILALISPRPLMIIYTENDPIFLASEVEAMLPLIQRIYQILDKKENLEIIKIPNKSHEFPIEYHEQAYEFFDKYLKNN